MLAASYGTVSDIEILFVILGLVGAAFSYYSLRDAMGDRDAVLEAGLKNGRRIFANFAVRQEAMRFAVLVIFVFIGVLAMTQPDPPVDLTPLQAIYSAVTRTGLVIAEGLIVAKSADAYRTRKQLKGD